MDIKLIKKQIYPAVINLRQYSSTDTLVFKLDEYIYEQHDLSQQPCYAVCDLGNGKIDKVPLPTKIVDGKLEATWKVTGYTTEKDGHITYQIVFGGSDEALWYSYKAIAIVNSSIDADSYIAANYPSILQEWERRMRELHDGVQTDVEEIRVAVAEAVNSAASAKLSEENAKKSADSANQALDNINRLIGYEPVDAIGKEVMQARGEYPLLGDRLDAIEAAASSGQVTFNRESFTTTDNQHRFTLTKGTYTLGGTFLKTFVNGILQPTEAIIEIDDTTFGLQETFEIVAGDIVDVEYYLISASPNMETPQGAQKKVDVLQRWTTNELTYKMGKNEADGLYEKKPLSSSTSLLASKWAGTSYIVDLQGVTANSIQHVSLAQTATLAQYEAFTVACLIQGTQTTNQFTLKALGEKPTIDIPIVVVIQGV